MRKRVKMTFIKGTNTKGYNGYWGMDYYVENIVDAETNELICSEYVFRQSTIFKGKGLKLGDIVEMNIRVSENNGKVKLSYYSDIRKVS